MLDALARQLGLGSMLLDLRARFGRPDRPRRSGVAALAVALLVSAGCVAPRPMVEAGGASNWAADSQVRDTPLVAANGATTLRPPLREASGRGGSSKLLQAVSARGLPDAPAIAGRADANARAVWPSRTQVLLPGSPRGPPAT